MRKILFASITIIAAISAITANATLQDKIRNLPLLHQRGTEIHYIGSIDKTGGNADWDWFLYQDTNGEWVILDVDGPGCIDNLTQHRYFTASDPLFRFYIDNATEPAYEVRLSEIGYRFPFSRPLADCYYGPYDNGRGPIRVIHSFVPIPFDKHCKVTTDAKLVGNDLQNSLSGWGHIVYHTMAEKSDHSISVSQKEEMQLQFLKTRGYNPLETLVRDTVSIPSATLAGGQSTTLCAIDNEGVISSLRLFADSWGNKAEPSEALRNVWISITFDGHTSPDVHCPLGAFAGNSLGYNSTEYLMMGLSENGALYNTFPMPFWHNAKVTLTNKSDKPFHLIGGTVLVADNTYDNAVAGYFRNTPYYTRRHTEGRDSHIGSVEGMGRMVAAHVTCWADKKNVISCEGDVHVYIDDERTPRIQSDGSESYISYGWGFPTPPESHPFGGYDGLTDNPWSMTRLCLIDDYPFYRNLNFYIESGEHNNQYLEHEGTVFYYGRSDIAMIATDSLAVADKRSAKSHCYKVTGAYTTHADTTCYEAVFDTQQQYRYNALQQGSKSEFTVSIAPDNRGVVLLRTSSQAQPRQHAQVYVDGQLVTERTWYHADNNPHKRLLDDTFVIPQRYTQGKSSIRLTIVPVTTVNTTSWTESSYHIYSYK